MSKLTQARAGVPRAGNYTETKARKCSPTLGKQLVKHRRPVHVAATLFLVQGAQAAHDFLGGSLRAKLLMPLVLLRAKYLERCAKRLQAAHPELAEQLGEPPLLKEAA